MSRIALSVEHSLPNCRRPGRWPNVVVTRVPSPVRRPSGLLTAHRTTTLTPGKLHGLRRLMRQTFPSPPMSPLPLGFACQTPLALIRSGQPRMPCGHLSELRPGFLWLNTVLHRHLLCAHFLPLSSVQLSPNRVWSNFGLDSVDL